MNDRVNDAMKLLTRQAKPSPSILLSYSREGEVVPFFHVVLQDLSIVTSSKFGLFVRVFTFFGLPKHVGTEHRQCFCQSIRSVDQEFKLELTNICKEEDSEGLGEMKSGVIARRSGVLLPQPHLT